MSLTVRVFVESIHCHHCFLLCANSKSHLPTKWIDCAVVDVASAVNLVIQVICRFSTTVCYQFSGPRIQGVSPKLQSGRCEQGGSVNGHAFLPVTSAGRRQVIITIYISIERNRKVVMTETIGSFRKYLISL